MRDPEKIMVMFTKNHMSDVFDISDCDLDDQQILDFVKRARKIHKTKGLKLSGNRLTSVGFDMLIDCLQGVSNINLSNNRIDASIFDVILRNKERLESLRIIHLSNN